MKNIKKWLALLVVGAMLAVSLVACGSNYKTVDELVDGMKDAKNLTISGEADGTELEIIYDGDKIQATVSMGGEVLIECFDKGADKMYIRIGDNWYETELASSQLEDVDVDAMIDEIKDIENAKLEKDGNDYIVKGESDDDTMKVSFSGKVSLPKDAKSIEDIDPSDLDDLSGMLG